MADFLDHGMAEPHVSTLLEVTDKLQVACATDMTLYVLEFQIVKSTLKIGS